MSFPRFAVASLSLFFCSPLWALTISTVPIGNPGNAPDSTGFGAVPYNYRIGTTEITNAQYTEFLNAVAASDPFELYDSRMGSSTFGGIIREGTPGNFAYSVKDPAIGQGPGGTNFTYEDKPVILVTWYDANRFANWLHNGQGNGDTETGAYTLLGGTPTPSNGPANGRSPNARWFIPSQDEWYKAAYYDLAENSYFQFPTGTDTEPNGNLPSGDTGNSINAGRANDDLFPYTDVGAYSLSVGPNGTFDQGGNVWEWTEGLDPLMTRRLLRGAAWSTPPDASASPLGSSSLADRATAFTGFRVAFIPEPAGAVLLMLVGLLLSMVRCRR